MNRAFLDWDSAARLIGAPTWQEIHESNLDWIFSVGDEARKAREAEGEQDETRLQEAAFAAECAEEKDLRRRWERSIEKTIERCFAWIGLKITRRGKGRGGPPGLAIEPITSWRNALGEVRDTINGVGMFWFPTDRDLVEVVGPCATARTAVLEHLHYAHQAADVYGYENPTRTFERVMEGGRA